MYLETRHRGLYSSLPIHVRYLYLFATNVFATHIFTLPGIFATRHNCSHPELGKDTHIGLTLKLNGREMISKYFLHGLV